MKKNTKQEDKWEAAENKAISMADKFIAVLQKLDCYSTWESILIDRIVEKKKEGSGIKGSGKCDFDSIIATLEYTFGFTILKGDSIAEQYKIEAFVDELYKNPYQLNLI